MGNIYRTRLIFYLILTPFLGLFCYSLLQDTKIAVRIAHEESIALSEKIDINQPSNTTRQSNGELKFERWLERKRDKTLYQGNAEKLQKISKLRLLDIKNFQPEGDSKKKALFQDETTGREVYFELGESVFDRVKLLAFGDFGVVVEVKKRLLYFPLSEVELRTLLD